MKKIFTIALTAFFAISASSVFAQTIDWSVDEILSPTTMISSTSTPSTEFNLSVVLKNNGTDSLVKGDSVWYNILVTNSNNQVIVAWPVLNRTTVYRQTLATKNIKMGDTMHINTAITIPAAINFSTNIKLVVQSIIFKNGKLLTDPTPSNNAKAVDLLWENPQKWGVSINDFNNGVFNVTPNPVVNNMKIDLNIHTAKADVNVEIVDLTGKIVKRESFAAGTINMNVNTSDLVNGVYFVKVNSGDINSTTKVVVSK